MASKTSSAVDEFFEDRPTVRKLFDRLHSEIKALGDLSMSISKTQIAYGAKRKFAWLWLAPATEKTPEGVLMLRLDMKSKVSHLFIAHVEESYNGKWTHQIPIMGVSLIQEIAKQGWLDDAYQFGMMERKRV